MTLNREQTMQMLEWHKIVSLNVGISTLSAEELNSIIALITDLTNENNEGDEAIIRALNAIGNVRRETKAYTVRDIETMFAVHFGTYTEKDKVKIADVFRLLNRISNEILEGADDNE